MPKLIISRKGMDAGSGGMASPILGNRLLSLPIPDLRSDIRYASLKAAPGLSYGALISQLSGKRLGFAHLDPDLVESDLPRPAGWKPVFGQTGAALSHLRSEGVGVGDLFLFFGWFREAEKMKGKWRYAPGCLNAHVLFGWLEVGQIIDLDLEAPPDWAIGHPHCQSAFTWNSGGNALFVAAEQSSCWPGKPGAGVFPFHESLILTAPGSPRRSDWWLPDCLFEESGSCKLSYHRHKTGEPCGRSGYKAVKAANRGQEFVAEMDDEVLAWVKGMFGHEWTNGRE